jgi:hypothetical protein
MPNTNTLSHDDKIKFMQMAAGICSFCINVNDLDKLVSLYEEVSEKQDQFSIKDAARVIMKVDERAEQRKIDELNKKSKK